LDFELPKAMEQLRSRLRLITETTPLQIGKDGFSLPIELVTSTQAILARKRSGKSYTDSALAEELLRHKQQIAAIDPTVAWWGCDPWRPAMGTVFRLWCLG
jgi:hypothetical protein